MQQGLAWMADAEKIRTATKFNPAVQHSQQRGNTRNPQGMRAGIELVGDTAQTAQKTQALHSRISQRIMAIDQQYDGQHQAIDAELQAALKACPATDRKSTRLNSSH